MSDGLNGMGNGRHRAAGGRAPGMGVALLFLSLLVLSGCPLKSRQPLGDARGAPMDEKLLGEWAAAGPGKAEEGILRIFRFNETEYYLESFDGKDRKTDRYRGYLATVDNVRFLNVQEIADKPSGGDFHFARISMPDDNALTLRIVEGDLPGGESATSGSGLLSYIRTHIENPKLYGDAIPLRRIPRRN